MIDTPVPEQIRQWIADLEAQRDEAENAIQDAAARMIAQR